MCSIFLKEAFMMLKFKKKNISEKELQSVNLDDTSIHRKDLFDF